MRATENLHHDHQQLARALGLIDRAIELAWGGTRDLHFFEQVADFIRTFADGTHYLKEEEGLFAALSSAMPPMQAGPVHCLLMEHGATIAETERVHAAIGLIRSGHEPGWNQLLDAAARYVAIVRVHMPKEEQGLFPLSNVLLSRELQETLGTAFEAIDAAVPQTIDEAVDGLERRLARHEQAPMAGPAPALASDVTDDARLAAVLASLAAGAVGAPAPARVRRR